MSTEGLGLIDLCAVDYKCDVCSKIFYFETTYNEHIKNHTVKRKYDCYICRKKFARKDSFARHMDVHNSK